MTIAHDLATQLSPDDAHLLLLALAGEDEATYQALSLAAAPHEVAGILRAALLPEDLILLGVQLALRYQKGSNLEPSVSAFLAARIFGTLGAASRAALVLQWDEDAKHDTRPAEFVSRPTPLTDALRATLGGLANQLLDEVIRAEIIVGLVDSLPADLRHSTRRTLVNAGRL